MKRLLLLLITAFALTACAFDFEQPSVRQDISLEGKEVLVSFSVPGAPFAPSTKTLGETPELQDLYVVVCGSNYQMREYKKAELISIDSNGYTYETKEAGETYSHTVDLYHFQVALTISYSSRTLHFLGNGPEVLALDNGYNVLPYLISEEGRQAYWQTIEIPRNTLTPKLDGSGHPIEITDPLSGQGTGLYEPNDNLSALLQHIPLVRNFAKIKVTAADAEISNFEPISYAVLNTPKSGTIAPYRNNASTLPFRFTGDSDEKTSGYQNLGFEELMELGYPGNMSRTVEFDTSIPPADWFEHPENADGRVIAYSP